MSGHADHTRQAAIDAVLPAVGQRWIAEQVADAVLGVVPAPDLAPIHAKADEWDAMSSAGDLWASWFAAQLRAVLAAYPTHQENHDV